MVPEARDEMMINLPGLPFLFVAGTRKDQRGAYTYLVNRCAKEGGRMATISKASASSI